MVVGLRVHDRRPDILILELTHLIVHVVQRSVGEHTVLIVWQRDDVVVALRLLRYLLEIKSQMVDSIVHSSVLYFCFGLAMFVHLVSLRERIIVA